MATLTQNIGDHDTHAIALRWSGRPFIPASDWTLTFTVKALASQADSLRLLQKSYPAQGITVSGNVATVEVLRADTFREADFPETGDPAFEATAGDYVWDIQAYEVASPNRTRTVASGTLTLARDVTRLGGLTGPIFVVEDPTLLTTGPTGPSAYDSYVATTSDDPVLSEAAWIASLGTASDPDTVIVASPANDDMIQRVGGSWVTRTIAQIKTALGLGSAAYTASGDYATAAQGTLADSASQPGHTHVSADVTDATSATTPAKLVLRGANGEAEFGDSANSFSGNGVASYSFSGLGVYGGSTSGSGVFGESESGAGVYADSTTGTALQVETASGTNHAEFGYTGDDRSFIRRVLGLIGWHRGNYAQTLGSPATLTADSALELPDAATGTLALREDIASGTITPYVGNLDFSGGLGGGGADFSTNKATLVAGDKIALLDSEAADSPKHGLLSAIVDFIIGTGRTLSGAWAFSSTTRPTSSGTGTVSATDLITAADGDTRYGPVSVLRLTAQTSSASTAYVDSGTTLTLDAGTYHFQGCVFGITASTTGGVIAQIKASSTLEIYSTLTRNANATAALYASATTMATTSQVGTGLAFADATSALVDAGANGKAARATFSGVVILTGSTTFTPRIAQRSATDAANPAYIDIGSHIVFTKIA